MEKDSKIFVAGHRGLVGSAILNNLRSKGYTNFLLRTHAELDLTDQAAVNEFFAAERLCVLVGGARRRYHGEQSVPCRFYLQ
jgi:nucleoside-diphosphate-sugar epimerase